MTAKRKRMKRRREREKRGEREEKTLRQGKREEKETIQVNLGEIRICCLEAFKLLLKGIVLVEGGVA